ncbi:MAG TPA: hypothetical protein VK283_08820 [Acidimicrobiales bacterium]|nr:hypothetical protein [Acidimicrobiales bacterium]
MAYTNQICDETGVWTGRCGHGQIVVTKGERFPQCEGCRRGIDWRLVGEGYKTRGHNAREQSIDAEEEGWWPGKEPEAATSEYWA